MPHAARLGLYCAFVLLAACAGRPPQAPAPVAPVVSRPLLESQAQAANDVLFRAIGLVGTPYRYGGNTPAGGFDCSGLIGYVYRDAAGVTLPRSTREMITLGSPNVARNALQPGDLIFFATATAGGRQVSHAGIYVGEGRFVHAPRTGGTVRLDSLAKPYWQNSYLQAKRVLVTPSLAGGY